MAGEATPDELVTEISCVKGGRGGKFIEEVFEIKGQDVVTALLADFNVVGAGALVFREQERSAVMMAAPLEFRFRARRDKEDARKNPSELIVTAHFVKLTERAGGKNPVWAFDSSRVVYPAAIKLAYKKSVAHAMAQLSHRRRTVRARAEFRAPSARRPPPARGCATRV